MESYTRQSNKAHTRQSDKGHIPLWVALTAIAVMCGGFWFGLS